MNTKLKYRVLTSEEWQNSKKCPLPHRNKKKYYRKEKHKAGWKTGSSFVYLPRI